MFEVKDKVLFNKWIDCMNWVNTNPIFEVTSFKYKKSGKQYSFKTNKINPDYIEKIYSSGSGGVSILYKNGKQIHFGTLEVLKNTMDKIKKNGETDSNIYLYDISEAGCYDGDFCKKEDCFSALDIRYIYRGDFMKIIAFADKHKINYY